jgi:C4-dicarboxylate-specific signal transduction histidine kinase
VVDRLGRWVSALVSYLHPLRPQLQVMPAVELLDAVLGLLRPRLEEKRIEVACAPWEPGARLAVDRDLMEQALYGLLGNALEAAAAGSPLLLGVRLEAAQVVLVIEDRAGGIPFIPDPSDLTPGPTTKRFGTGLGIPVAFKVCKAHGWDLRFEVVDNAGTRITLVAPAAT